MNILLRRSRYRTRCQFSKKIIKPGNYILQFDKKQYQYFYKSVYKILNHILPKVIIDIIIEKTNYKKYIDHWGLVLYVDWIENIHNKHLLYKKNYLTLVSDSDNDSDNYSDNDSDSDNDRDNC